jgi:hypothetical protein
MSPYHRHKFCACLDDLSLVARVRPKMIAYTDMTSMAKKTTKGDVSFTKNVADRNTPRTRDSDCRHMARRAQDR